MLIALVLLALPSPPAKGHWSLDTTGRLSADTLAGFDAKAKALDDTGLGQLGLLVTSTTSGQQPRFYATQVFNSWGIGHKGRNDGVLLFIALDDRKAEIILGDGFPAGAESRTDAIMRDDVVANLKASRLDFAVTQTAASLSLFVKGAFEVQRQRPAPNDLQPAPVIPDRVLLDDLLIDGQLPEKSPREWTLDLEHVLEPGQQPELDREGDAVYASGKGMLFVVLLKTDRNLSMIAMTLRQQLGRNDIWVLYAAFDASRLALVAPDALDNAEVRHAVSDIEDRGRQAMNGPRAEAIEGVLSAARATASLAVNGPPEEPLMEKVKAGAQRYITLLLLLLGSGGVLGIAVLRSWMRSRPRICNGCSNPRHRLSEETDDPHLNEGQRTEESIGSVDYDVWWCGRCNDALVLRYGAFFTRYSRCASCGYKTASSTSVTLVSATYDHGGTVQVTERCQQCSYVNTYTRYTSRLTRSSSSSSSSSSRSSFGGGSSSGRGSSGSW